MGHDASRQVVEFVEQCVREGLEADAIVILARTHEPSRDLYEEALDQVITHRVEAALRERGGQGDQVGFIDWFSPEPQDEPELSLSLLPFGQGTGQSSGVRTRVTAGAKVWRRRARGAAAVRGSGRV